MQYKYQWFYALGLNTFIVLIGFYFFIYPALTSIISLRTEKLNLLQKIKNRIPINNNDAINPQQIKFVDKKMVLTDLLNLLQFHGLNVKSIGFLNTQVPEYAGRHLLSLAADGDFVQLSNFILGISTQIHSVVITHFFFQTKDNDKLQINLELLILDAPDFVYLKNKRLTNQIVLSHPSNPFCNSNTPSSNIVNSFLFSVEQMKMIGFLRQGGHKQAVILLPNETVMIVEQATVLGKEKGMVVDIKPNKTLVNLPNKKQLELNL